MASEVTIILGPQDLHPFFLGAVEPDDSSKMILLTSNNEPDAIYPSNFYQGSLLWFNHTSDTNSTTVVLADCDGQYIFSALLSSIQSTQAVLSHYLDHQLVTLVKT